MRQPGRSTATSLWGRVAAFARAQDLGDDEFVSLESLCAAVTDLLGVAGACVTSAEGACLASSPTQPGVGEVDTLQYALGSGPGPTAIGSGEVVAISDTRADDRWPAFVEAATVAGFRGVLSVPLDRPHGIDATLSIYSSPPRAWSDDERDATVVMCAISTAWASGSQVLHEQTRVVDQLQHALDSRVLIEQAKGVLAVLEQVRPDEAFELMRSHARRRGIPVREVAEAVIRLGFRPPRVPARPSGAGARRGAFEG